MEAPRRNPPRTCRKKQKIDQPVTFKSSKQHVGTEEPALYTQQRPLEALHGPKAHRDGPYSDTTTALLHFSRTGVNLVFEDTDATTPKKNTFLANVNAGEPVVTIHFTSVGGEETNESHSFSEKFLTQNFHYFRTGLAMNQSGSVFVEGDTKKFHLEEISHQAFLRIIIYLEQRSEPGFDEKGKYRQAESIHGLVQAVIAADYLSMVDFQAFETYTAARLAGSLILDRLGVSPPLLILVTTHPAFRSSLFWSICVLAAVQPVLHKGYEIDKQLVLRNHYSGLRLSYSLYDEAVKERIVEMKETLMVWHIWSLFRDPLYFVAETNGVDVDQRHAWFVQT